MSRRRRRRSRRRVSCRRGICFCCTIWIGAQSQTLAHFALGRIRAGGGQRKTVGVGRPRQRRRRLRRQSSSSPGGWRDAPVRPFSGSLRSGTGRRHTGARPEYGRPAGGGARLGCSRLDSSQQLFPPTKQSRSYSTTPATSTFPSAALQQARQEKLLEEQRTKRAQSVRPRQCGSQTAVDLAMRAQTPERVKGAAVCGSRRRGQLAAVCAARGTVDDLQEKFFASQPFSPQSSTTADLSAPIGGHMLSKSCRKCCCCCCRLWLGPAGLL